MVANSPYGNAMRDWCAAVKFGDTEGAAEAAARLDAICAPRYREPIWLLAPALLLAQCAVILSVWVWFR